MTPPRVLIVDDDDLMRAGPRAMPSDETIDVVAEAADGYEAIVRTRRIKPDVVLMMCAYPTWTASPPPARSLPRLRTQQETVGRGAVCGYWSRRGSGNPRLV
jgi:DNA-binding NarL/FixJ family response regulator